MHPLSKKLHKLRHHRNANMPAANTSDFGECGLLGIRPAVDHRSQPTEFPIPLQFVQVEASVVHAAAQVEITQVFVNKEDVSTVEAVYYFPLDPSAAVTHFEAELDGRKIKTVVKPDGEAKEEFDKAIMGQNQTALQSEENKAGIFKVRLGYLKPGSAAKIMIGYITEVKNERDSIRFYIPTTVAPRYVPMETTDEMASGLRNLQFSETFPAPMTIKTHVSIQGDIKSIESPTHKIVVSSQGPVTGRTGWTKASVELNGTTRDLDRDFVLLVTPAEPRRPTVYIEKLDDSYAVMANLIVSSQSALKDFRVKWHGVKEDVTELQPIFDGSQLLVFGIFGNQPTGCTITADSPDGPVSVDIQFAEQNNVGTTGMLHKLAATKIVREMEMKVAAFEPINAGRGDPGVSEVTQLYKEKITELAVREGIASGFTSFVAVDTTSSREYGAASESWVMQTSMVPSYLEGGWHGRTPGETFASLAHSPIPERALSSGPPSTGWSMSTDTPMQGEADRFILSSADPRHASYQYQPPPLKQPSQLPQGQIHPSTAPGSSAELEVMKREFFQRTSPTPPYPATSPRNVTNDKLQQIISYQTFTGYFKAADLLLQKLDLDIIKAKQVAAQNGWCYDAWATALALTYLEEKLKDWEHIWEPVATKAKKWLSENHGEVEAVMLAAAALLIKSNE